MAKDPFIQNFGKRIRTLRLERGLIRYARVCDVQAWEQARLNKPQPTTPRQVHPDLAEFL